MSSKVLIIGAGGRIGRRIVPLLSPRFDWVFADRQQGEIAGKRVHAVDITDYAATLAAMQGVDTVVHMAIASARRFVTDKARFHDGAGEEYLRYNEAAIDVNIRGTYHVFEAARAAGVKRVVYCSSLTVFLGEPRREAYHDDLPFQPSNFYAVTKLFGEHLGQLYSRKFGLTVYCLRFGTPHPLPDPEEAPSRRAGGKTSVTYLDLAGALEAAVAVADGPDFGAYSIVSCRDNAVFDCSKATAELGWQARTHCGANGKITLLDAADEGSLPLPVNGARAGGKTVSVAS